LNDEAGSRRFEMHQIVAAFLAGNQPVERADKIVLQLGGERQVSAVSSAFCALDDHLP
jgi:hypothetical protein